MPKRSIAAISASRRAMDRDVHPPHGETADDMPNHPSTSTSIQAHQSQLASAKRRITSCAACRKQKIKCELLTDRPPCERCKRRNIECVINTGLRNSILDQRQLAVLGRDLNRVHATLEVVCRQLGMESLKPLESAILNATGASAGPSTQDGDLDDGSDGPNDTSHQTTSRSPSDVPTPMDVFLKLEAEAGLYGRINVLVPPLPQKPDLISKGLISLQDAEVLANHYFVEMDPILFGFVKDHHTIQGLRAASPTLVAGICTVAALHLTDYGHLFERCYREYRHMVSASLFEKSDVEHIRALLIGSFWFPGASRILLCDAIRRAGDARLYQYISKAIDGMPQNSSTPSSTGSNQAEYRDRVRLCYGMLMSDQHQSILNNRHAFLPLNLEVIKRREEYLEGEDAMNHDLRLVAHFSLLLIMSKMKRTFGSECATPVPASAAPKFHDFSAELKEWIDRFRPRFRPTMEMGNFPSLAFRLHRLFGELYLGHHVFRGLQGSLIPKALLKAARTAYDAAVSIFRMILEADGLLSSLSKVPGYFLIMISFAGHLILELCAKHRDQLHISVEDDYQMLSAVVSALTSIRVISHHPLSRVAHVLRKRLLDFAAQYSRETTVDDGAEWPLQNEPETCPSATLTDSPDDTEEQPGPMLDMAAAGLPNEFFFTDFSYTFQDAQTDFMRV